MGGNRSSFWLGGDRDTPKSGFGVSSGVESPKTKLSLKLFKSYSLLILILDTF